MEIWKDICGFEGFYQVSNKGNVRSLPHTVTQKSKGGGTHTQSKPGRLLKQNLNTKGYMRVLLHANGVRKHPLVHRLVAEAFLPNPENKPQVNHKDGVKTNNEASNLEWVDNSYNQKHARTLGLIVDCKGENKPDAKLTENDVRYIREHYKRGSRTFGSPALAKKFGVHKQTILNIVNRKKWKHI